MLHSKVWRNVIAFSHTVVRSRLSLGRSGRTGQISLYEVDWGENTEYLRPLHAAHCLSETKASCRELYMAKAGCEAHIDLTYLLISGSDIQLCFHIPGGGMAAGTSRSGHMSTTQSFPPTRLPVCPSIPRRCVPSGK